MALISKLAPARNRPVIRWWLYVLAALLLLLARLPTLNNHIFYFDEPAYLVQAMRLDSLQSFIFAFEYRNETKFPLGLAPYEAALTLSQEQAIFVLHWFGLVVTILSGWLLLALSRQMFGQYGPGWFGLLVWVAVLNRHYQNAATLIEHFQTPLLLLAIWCCVQALRGQARLMGAAGLCLGLAVLMKPPGLLLVPVFGLIYLCHHLMQPAKNWRIGFKGCAWLLSGFGFPILLMLAPYFFRPSALAELQFNLFQVGSEYATSFRGKSGWLTSISWLLDRVGPTLLILLLISVGWWLFEIWKRPSHRWETQDSYRLLLVFSGSGLFIGYLAGQGQHHYMVSILPPWLLFIGCQLGRIYIQLPRYRQKLALVCFILWMIVSEAVAIQNYVFFYFDSATLYSEQLPDLDQSALVNYIKANSGPQDYIWVYLYAPEIYWQADRKPATNEPTGSWLQDFRGQVWYERTLRELKRDRPSLIVAINKPRTLTPAIPLEELPLISDYIRQAYDCNNNQISGAIVCKRRSDSSADS